MGYLEESARLLTSPGFEDSIPYMYRDNAMRKGKHANDPNIPVGNVTVGVGYLIPGADAAARLPFEHPTGTAATVEEIKAEL